MISGIHLRQLAVALILCTSLPALAEAEPAALAKATAATAAPSEDVDDESTAEASGDILANAAGAERAIEKLHDTLLAVMKKPGYDGRFTELMAELPKTYDIGFMARMSVGRRQWKQLSPEEQQRWLDSFGKLLAANYAGRFKGFSGHAFKTLGHEAANNSTLLVRTELLVPGEENVYLNYRMRLDGDTWRIIDVFLNGTVSEVALRRSEYGSVLKRDGFPKLMTTLEAKIADLKREGSS